MRSIRSGRSTWSRSAAYRLPRIGITFTLLLGRPFDQALLRALLDKLQAAPATALAVSDGRGIRASTGDGELAAVAGTLVGREAEASFAPDGADWTAAAVPVADKLWVVGLAHRSVRAQPLAAVLACGAAGVALLLLGVVLLLRRKQDRPSGAERSVDAPAVAPIGDGRLSPAAMPARRSPPQLAVVPHLTPAVANAGAGAGGRDRAGGRGGPAVRPLSARRTDRRRRDGRGLHGGPERRRRVRTSGGHQAPQAPSGAEPRRRVSQFIDEAKLGSVLAHSNIVTVSDFGKVGEGYYLAAGIRRRAHAGADRRRATASNTAGRYPPRSSFTSSTRCWRASATRTTAWTHKGGRWASSIVTCRRRTS